MQMSRRDFSASFSSPFLFSFQHPASNSKKVYLKGVTLKSTGLYRCEISAEEPDFKTVAGEGKLEVVCKLETLRNPLILQCFFEMSRDWNTQEYGK